MQHIEIVAAKSDITFYKTSLNEGLYPIFVNIYIII